METEKTQAVRSSDTIFLFIQKYRTFFVVLLALIVAGLLGSVAFFSVRNQMQKKAIAKLEEIEKQKTELGDVKDAEAEKVDAILNDLIAFAPTAFGYASAKAYALAADIYAARNEWNLAEESWLHSAQKGAKTYLAPISLFNAAVAAEEQGKLEEALNYYKQTLDFTGIFAAAQRARFNIGRICEAQGDKEAAKEAYRILIEKGGGDSSWAKLAQSRIIALELE
jgi:tetratricopeptide (TPR) repeat protein